MTLPPPADPERALSLAYVPAAARDAVHAIWLLDERLSAIVVEPNRPIAAIKLAWWREALERLDAAPPPPEPLLQALADVVRVHGVTGAQIARIAAGWDVLIDDDEDDRFARHAGLRGAALFGVVAAVSGGAGRDDAKVLAAGAYWAAATVPASLGTVADRAAVLADRPVRVARWPRPLRALGVLSVLGEARLRDPAGRAGSPARVARALWLAMTGL